MMRAVRVLRGLRILRFVSSLRLMLRCVMGTFVQFFWCVVMILGMLYLFAVYFVQTATLHLETVEGIDSDKLLSSFGSVQDAMLSLLTATTGGEDWISLYDAIRPLGLLECLVFLFFILFFIISIWNIVTSMFVEQALLLAQPDIDEIMVQARRKDVSDALELQKLFERADKDKSNTISLNEFSEFLLEPKFEHYLRARGIDIKEAKTFFTMVAASTMEADQSVDIGSFVAFCLRTRGYATSIDLHSMSFEMKLMFRKQAAAFRQFKEELQPRFDELKRISLHLKSQTNELGRNSLHQSNVPWSSGEPI